MIQFNCSKCGKTVRVGDEAAGKRGKCPQCSETLVVPEPEMVQLHAVDTPSVPPPAAPPPHAHTHHQTHATSTPPRANRKHRKWIGVFTVVALLAAPLIPGFPLWLGIILLVCCIAVFVPVIDRLAKRFLRIDFARKWQSGLRLAMYGLLACVLLVTAWGGMQFKSYRARVAEEREAEKSEQLRLVEEANAEVDALVAEAQTAWASGNRALAYAKLEEADQLLRATNRGTAHNLQARIGNEESTELLDDAISLVNQDDLEAGLATVRRAIAVEHATETNSAKKLENQILTATEAGHMRAGLMSLSDESFQALQDSGTMPTEMISGYDELDRRASELALSQVSEVAVAREERRQAEIAAEMARQEEARLAAEAEREAQERRRAEAEERRNAAQREIQDRLDAYIALLEAAEVTIVQSVSVRRSGDNIWTATLTVKDIWHIRHYQIRLQDAQALWEGWATIASPREPDLARISIVDGRGNEVGGSRILAGSLIWVKDD